MQRVRRKRRRLKRPDLYVAAVLIIAVVVFLTAAFCSRDTTDAITSEVADPQETTETSEVLAASVTTEETLTEEAPELISLGEFTVTAYCPCEICCGVWSEEHPSRIGTDYVQKTASGTIPTAGRTIGVDPEVIPYGTTVIIDGHEYIAEDTGSALEGNTIDIFFDTHEEALEYGRQTVEVFIKSDAAY
ncbi:MAG: 3D domain-containing protein [Oscillospiraceae bacterium]|nr:3D domain-containing protein [Oscillospiraceae bacterium]